MLQGYLYTEFDEFLPIQWSLHKTPNDARLFLDLWCIDPSNDPREFLSTILFFAPILDLMEELIPSFPSSKPRIFQVDSWKGAKALRAIAQVTQFDEKTLLRFERGFIVRCDFNHGVPAPTHHT